MSNEALGMLVTFGFIGFTCGIVCMVLASNKDRSAGGFFFVGFLFGPLGILATVLVGRGEPRAPQGTRAIACPRCNARQNVAKDAAEYECWQCKLVSPTPAANSAR